MTIDEQVKKKFKLSRCASKWVRYEMRGLGQTKHIKKWVNQRGGVVPQNALDALAYLRYAKAYIDQDRVETDKRRGRTRRWCVYYVDDGHDHIKIGTSRDFKTRFSDLRRSNSQLVVAAVEEGRIGKERKRHKQFAKERIKGTEWFRKSERLQDWVDLLAAIRRLEATQSR